MSKTHVVQFADGRYYRELREPRHFQHNATKMTEKQANAVSAIVGGQVKIIQQQVPLGE